jgi:pre-mRNA-splicing helicase BRR2
LQRTSKLKGLLEILSSAHEFHFVNVRDEREASSLQTLARHLPVTLPSKADFTSSSIKVEVLLQCYFGRVPVSAGMSHDMRQIVPIGVRLLQAMVDVLSSSGWLLPALGCMELSQMMTQQMWNTHSPLLQLPHVDVGFVKYANQKYNVYRINDLIDLEDEDRMSLLSKFTEQQIADIASFCNAYPDIEMTYSVDVDDDAGEQIRAGDTVSVTVQLNREIEEEELTANKGVGLLSRASRYPSKKTENWWIVIGKQESNELLSIKRLVFNKPSMTVKLEFDAPSAGRHELLLNLMSDSYIGVDQEMKIPIHVREGSATVHEEDSDVEVEGDAITETVNGMHAE